MPNCLGLLDIGFYDFKRQLLYKEKQKGCQVIIVDRFSPSSKMCSNPSCSQKTELNLGQRD
ncbi:MAG: zinc ribbon domain-containing protein [Oligoflexales bacterium]